MRESLVVLFERVILRSWITNGDPSMPVSSHLSRKLQEILGQEAAEDLVSWTKNVDSQSGDVAELRHEMQLGFARIESTIARGLSELRADLMKWSLVFWVGAVGAIAALAGVLR